MIAAIRDRLLASGKPYVIENVKGARYELRNAVYLCGTMFGLPIHRHRYFETSWLFTALLPPCGTEGQIYYITGSRKVEGDYVPEPTAVERGEYLGIDWMTIAEMDEAIPPAFGEYMGWHLMEECRRHDGFTEIFTQRA